MRHWKLAYAGGGEDAGRQALSTSLICAAGSRRCAMIAPRPPAETQWRSCQIWHQILSLARGGESRHQPFMAADLPLLCKQLLCLDLYVVRESDLPCACGAVSTHAARMCVGGSEPEQKAMILQLLGPQGLVIEAIEEATGCSVSLQRRGVPRHQSTYLLIQARDSRDRAKIRLEAARRNIHLIMHQSSITRHRQLLISAVLNGSSQCQPCRPIPLTTVDPFYSDKSHVLSSIVSLLDD